MSSIAALKQQLAQIKEQGNKAFSTSKFSAAASLYTEAITLAEPPSDSVRADVSILRSNRALCHRMLGDWASCEEDALRAVSLDDTNSRAHYLIGLCGVRKDKFEDSVSSLRKALQLAEAAKKPQSLLKEIREAIESGCEKWREHHIASERMKDTVLRSIVESSVAEAAAASSATSGSASEGAAAGGSGDEEDISPAATLRHFDAIMNAREKARDSEAAPDWATCPISMELMCDPVMTPSGHTYERSTIVDYIRKSPRAADPLDSKVALRIEDLRPNLTLRKAIAEWLEIHPWARPVGTATTGTPTSR